MTDLNVALVLRLIDKMSGPADKVRASLKGMGVGAKEFRRAFAKEITAGFSEANIEKALARQEQAIARARGRMVGALGMAVTLAAPVVVSARMQKSLIEYGNLAGKTTDQLAALRLQLDALSRRDKTGMATGDLLAGLQTYVGKGLDDKAALTALLPTGRAAKATGAAFDEMAAAGFAAMDNLHVAPDRLAKAFDAMAMSGKEGSFELKDMARAFPVITAGARALGVEGVQGVASLSAALQVAMKSAGSADQAANNFANFLGKLTAPDTVKKFKKMGVDIKAELAKATKAGEDPIEHMLGVIQRVTKGDQFKMGELFQDKQVLDFLRAAIPNLEEYRRIKAKALAADGVLDADYNRVQGGFLEATTQFKQSLGELFSSSGALLPVLTDIVNHGTTIIYTISDWTKANPELTATLVKGGAALLAFGIGSRVLGLGFAYLRRDTLRVLSMFLKFNEAGRNVSFAARSLRGLVSGARALRWIGRISLSSLIAPVRWGSRLVGKLPWARLAGRLSWRLLVAPLKWGAYIGRLSWSKFITPLTLKMLAPGVTRVGPAMEKAARRSEAAAARMNRAVSGMRMRALGALGLAAALAASMPGGSLEEIGAQQAQNRKTMDKTFRATPGLGSLMRGYEWLSKKVHGDPEATAKPQLYPEPTVRRRSWAAPRDPATPVGPQLVDPRRAEFKADYRSEQAITVTVPVQIVRKMEVDYDRIAREVGRKTEAATRRALSDSEGPQ